MPKTSQQLTQPELDPQPPQLPSADQETRVTETSLAGDRCAGSAAHRECRRRLASEQEQPIDEDNTSSNAASRWSRSTNA